MIGSPALASVSMEQGRVAMCHAFEIDYKTKVSDLTPFGVYTIPEISMAGATEEELKQDGRRLRSRPCAASRTTHVVRSPASGTAC